MKTPLYLLKDIVIPAGTKFEAAPLETSRCAEGHVSHIIGLSKDTSGEVVYFVGDQESIERKQLMDIFSEEPPEPKEGPNGHDFAGDLYDTYCKAVGGVAFNGDPLPGWEEFSSDPNKEKQSNAWVATAKRAIDLLT